MIRERVLKVVLVAIGLLFIAGIYPLLRMHPEPAEGMLGVVYITLGFFLLLAAWNPSANRSLIAFTAWSSFAHGGTMAVQAVRGQIPGLDLLRAVLPLWVIGIALIALRPRRGKTTPATELR
jgi:peptidoglycan/LPS O-acetylase OafA/YrhL